MIAVVTLAISVTSALVSIPANFVLLALSKLILAELAVIALAWVVVMPTLALFVVISAACCVVMPVFALFVATFDSKASKSTGWVTVIYPTLVASAEGYVFLRVLAATLVFALTRASV